MPEHLRTIEEIEREGIPGLVEVLREEGVDAVCYAPLIGMPSKQPADEGPFCTGAGGLRAGVPKKILATAGRWFGAAL